VPRQSDPYLEQNILEAASRLWARGGEKSLTMRAVAKAAGTTTPTVYERFRDRDDILRGLRLKHGRNFSISSAALALWRKPARVILSSPFSTVKLMEYFSTALPSHLPCMNRGLRLISFASVSPDGWAERLVTIPA
jgi:AcrR family transcriptional regulator